jgi:hypothetical protein
MMPAHTEIEEAKLLQCIISEGNGMIGMVPESRKDGGNVPGLG